MRIQKLMFFFFLAIAASLAYSCDDDEADTVAADCPAGVSYSMDIVPILSVTCAIPTCHQNGFAFGDFTLFDPLEAVANSGLLASQIETRAMPPSNTPGPTELTDDELSTFLCWIEQGALEN